MSIELEPPQSILADLHSKDHERRNKAHQYFQEATREPVEWAYSVWDDLLETLRTGDNGQSPHRLCAVWPRAIPKIV